MTDISGRQRGPPRRHDASYFDVSKVDGLPSSASCGRSHRGFCCRLGIKHIVRGPLFEAACLWPGETQNDVSPSYLRSGAADEDV